MSELKQTCLHAKHLELKAKMVDFGGWHMPVQYSSITKEHEAVRTEAGLFDVSHMGTFEVTGPQAKAFLQYLVPNNIDKLTPGRGLYTQLCKEDGTTLDDLLIFQVASERFFLIVNASNREKDFNWIASHVPEDVTLENKAEQTAILALQGPLAETVLAPHVDVDLRAMKPFDICPVHFGEYTFFLTRSGYTGEDGFELYAPVADAPSIWDALLAHEKVSPIGLGARDTLRLEAAMPLYGHELDENTTPLEAGLGWSVKLKTEADFIGKSALIELKAKGLPQKRVGLILENTRRAPRQGYRIFSQGEPIGIITSGSLSPTLNQPIGLGLIQGNLQPEQVEVEVRNQMLPAKFVKLPFYRRSS